MIAASFPKMAPDWHWFGGFNAQIIRGNRSMSRSAEHCRRSLLGQLTNLRT